MQHVLRPSSPSIFRRHFTATFDEGGDDSGHKSGWTDDATEGGLDVGTKGEASFHIARWKEGRRARAVGFPLSENTRNCQGQRRRDVSRQN